MYILLAARLVCLFALFKSFKYSHRSHHTLIFLVIPRFIFLPLKRTDLLYCIKGIAFQISNIYNEDHT